jgi:N-acetylmuramoyl-L-alanine amidase
MGLLITLSAVGCVNNSAASLTPSRVDDRIPVTNLAQQLGMQIGRTSRYSAAMTRGTDSLLIVGPPRPLVILNGQRIGNGSGISEQHGRLMVERGLASQISRQLGRRPVNPSPAWPASPIPIAGAATVVLDAGHGGKDPGAPNRYGPTESILVMDAVHRIAQLLVQRNVHVILTRSDDTFIELNERADIANRARADLFVSIHADSHPDADIDGFTVYIARQVGSETKALAARAAESLNRQIPTCRGIRKQDFRVLVKTKMPAILIEMGYLTNRTEAAKLSTLGYRQRVAEAIADSIVAYINGR